MCVCVYVCTSYISSIPLENFDSHTYTHTIQSGGRKQQWAPQTGKLKRGPADLSQPPGWPLVLLLAIVIVPLRIDLADSGSHKQTQTKPRGPRVYAMSPHLPTFEKVEGTHQASQGFSQPPPGASLPLLRCPVLHLVTDEHGRSQSLHLL